MLNTTRRELLKYAALSSLGALNLHYSSVVSAINNLQHISVEHNLNDSEFILLTDLVDVIFPKTDTPSASTANVHIFIDFMFNKWMSNKQRSLFQQGLQQLNYIAERDNKMSFVALDIDNKTRILSSFESRTTEGVGEKEHNNNLAFFSLLKHLIIVGYFTSEIGVKEALDHDPIPGSYLKCTKFDASYRSSYIDVFRGLSQGGYTDE